MKNFGNPPFEFSGNLDLFCQALNEGEMIAYPTETVWGLGVDIRFEKAIEALFALKGRSSQKSVSLLVSDVSMAKQLAEIDPQTEHLIHLFWPGPVTFVLPAKKTVPSSIHGGTGFVGLRRSNHIFVRKLFEKYDHPITTTSLNQSGEPAARSFEETQWLPSEVKVVPWSEQLTGCGSSVVRIQGRAIACLRRGDFDMELFRRMAESLNFVFES